MKTKGLLLLIMCFLLIGNTFAQISVNTDGSAPASSAMLDVSSTTKGFLPPRMTQAQISAIANPAEGLMVYCTDCTQGKELYFFNGAVWLSVIDGQPITTGGVVSISNANFTGVAYAYCLTNSPYYGAGSDFFVTWRITNATASPYGPVDYTEPVKEGSHSGDIFEFGLYPQGDYSSVTVAPYSYVDLTYRLGVGLEGESNDLYMTFDAGGLTNYATYTPVVPDLDFVWVVTTNYNMLDCGNNNYMGSGTFSINLTITNNEPSGIGIIDLNNWSIYRRFSMAPNSNYANNPYGNDYFIDAESFSVRDVGANGGTATIDFTGFNCIGNNYANSYSDPFLFYFLDQFDNSDILEIPVACQ